MLTTHNMYSPHNWEKFAQQFQTYLSEKPKIVSAIFITYLKSTRKFFHLEKNYRLHSINISEVLHSEKYSYLNAKKQLFQNTLQEWTCSRVPNTAQMFIGALFSYFFINTTQIELENMSLNQTENLRSVS